MSFRPIACRYRTIVRQTLLPGLIVIAAVGTAQAQVPVPVATYTFNGNLNAQQGGVPALTATDPLGTNAFSTATVFGVTRPIYQTIGAAPFAQEAGLTLDTTGLIPTNNYSVEMVFAFTQNANGWRRIIDVSDRTQDTGLYVDTSNHVDVFNTGGGTSPFALNTFFDVFVTVDPANNVNLYLNGTLEHTTTTTVMNIANPGDLMHFFLDNSNSEYSNANTALIEVFNSALTSGDVATLSADPFANAGPSPSVTAPEPGSAALAAFGAFPLLAVLRLRRRTRA